MSPGLTKDQKEARASESRMETVFSAERLPQQFHADVLGGINCQAVLDMTAGQGEMCKACLDARQPVLAVCVSDTHCEQLEEKLTKYCLRKFTEKGHTLFREEASKYLTEAGEEKKAETETKDESKPPPPKKNKKGQKGKIRREQGVRSVRRVKEKTRRKKKNLMMSQEKPKSERSRKSQRAVKKSGEGQHQSR